MRPALQGAWRSALTVYRALGTLLPAAAGAGALATLRLQGAPAVDETETPGETGVAVTPHVRARPA